MYVHLDFLPRPIIQHAQNHYFSPQIYSLSRWWCHPNYNSAVPSLISDSPSHPLFMNKSLEQGKCTIGLHRPVAPWLQQSCSHQAWPVSVSCPFPLLQASLSWLFSTSQRTQFPFQVSPLLGSPSSIFTPLPFSWILFLGPTCSQSFNPISSMIYAFRTVHLITSEIRMSPAPTQW